MRKIPKIIHHIAPKQKQSWHPIWTDCHPSWEKHFKDFTIITWSDTDGIDNLVKENYPEYFDFYNNLPEHIMKIDFARLCILHNYGGIYADMDMFCYQNFYEELTEDFYIVESPYGQRYFNGDLKVENCLMCSTKENEFVGKLIEECEENFNKRVKMYYEDIGDISQNVLIGKTAGPLYICEKMIECNIKNILPGNLYNNHGLSYNKKFKTKHMLTAIWGNRFLISKDDMYNYNMKKYSECLKYDFNEKIDYYKDYTDGQYIPV